MIPPWLRHALREGARLALHAAAVVAAYRLAYWARFGWPILVARFPPSGAPGWPAYEGLLRPALPIWLLSFWLLAKLYDRPWAAASDRFLATLKGSAAATVAIFAAVHLSNRLEYSRLALALAAGLAAGLAVLADALVRRIDEALARLEAARPVLIIGQGPLARLVRERILRRHPRAEAVELPDMPQADELRAELIRKRYVEIILLRSAQPHARVLEAAEICEACGAGFKMLPDILEMRLGEIQMDESLGLPSFRIQHLSMTRVNFAAKRAFDLVLSSLILIAASPILLAAALIITLDSPGPVFFKQTRYGHKGRVFLAYKFRTMSAGAEAKVGEIRESAGGGDPFFKAKRDPRVTRAGKWLRRFSLDEFPQFINVLRGEMSVVGPRPLALTTGEAEKLRSLYGETAKKRLNALPGITGLWQISGRSEVGDEERFAMDLFYIEHWSLGLDLEIALKTPGAMIFGKGAY
ncbi:MAG: sugar transferase [Elusimicrobiota bacterium]